jgi:hypothetical protein
MTLVQDSGAPGTWRRYLYQYMPDMFRRYWGVRFGATLGMLWDDLSQAVRDAVFSAYHYEDGGPAYDALRPLGNELSMPQYSEEDWLQYRSRLQTDWETWARAGDESTIIEQLALAGAPGAQIFRFSENGSWSEFVVFYPAGTHPVTGTPEVGGFTVGDGTIVGPIGITVSQLSSLRGLITHWKPARWKCPWLIWELDGWTVGTGHTIGEPGLVIGGTQVKTSVQI